MVVLGAHLGGPRPCEQQTRQWTFPSWTPGCFAHVSYVIPAPPCLRRNDGASFHMLLSAFIIVISYSYYMTTPCHHKAPSLQSQNRAPVFLFSSPPKPTPGPTRWYLCLPVSPVLWVLTAQPAVPDSHPCFLGELTGWPAWLGRHTLPHPTFPCRQLSHTHSQPCSGRVHHNKAPRLHRLFEKDSPSGH